MSQTKPTEKEAATFARSYVLYGCKTRATRDAFPQTKASKQNTSRTAQRVFKAESTQRYIKEFQELSRAMACKEFKADAEGIKDMLMTVAHNGLKELTLLNGNVRYVDLKATISALSEVNRMDGNHAAIKQEHYGAEGEPLAASSVIITSDPAEAAKIYAKMIGS